MIWGTYLGGGCAEQAGGIAIDPSLRVALGGNTCSTGFPTTPGVVEPNYLGGGTDGFVAVFLPPLGSAGVPAGVVEDRGLRLSATNPASHAVRFSCTTPPGVPGQVEIFDLLGRQVRVPARTSGSGGTTEVTWDLRDGSGRRVPGGVYYARLSADGRHVGVRVVVTP